MADVTVSAEDVRLVCNAVATLHQAFAGTTLQVGIAAPALQALARMATAADQAGMPECPVSTADEAAVVDQSTVEAYEMHGFSRDEAFQILCMNVEARLRVAVARNVHGC